MDKMITHSLLLMPCFGLEESRSGMDKECQGIVKRQLVKTLAKHFSPERSYQLSTGNRNNKHTHTKIERLENKERYLFSRDSDLMPVSKRLLKEFDGRVKTAEALISILDQSLSEINVLLLSCTSYSGEELTIPVSSVLRKKEAIQESQDKDSK